MAERRKSKSKVNEGEEGIDGAKQKKGGGGGKDHQQPHHKKTGIAHGARFVYKRMTGQPRSSTQESPQQHKESKWDLWDKTSSSSAKSTDPGQPMASASGAVIPSTEETEPDDIVLSKSEGATPPIPMKHDHDDDTNITTDINVPSEAVVPQQPSDDPEPELSLKLARIELENERHKRELEDKERQIKEYEEEIIKLRTQKSRSGGGRGGGGGGVQVVVDQSTTQKLQQLEKEKEELMMENEQLTKEKEVVKEALTNEKEALMKEKAAVEETVVKDEDRITKLTQLLKEEEEKKRKAEEQTANLEEKHIKELEGIQKQLDTEIAEKNQLEMNYQQKYEAQKEQYKKEMDEKVEQLLEGIAEEEKKDKAVFKEMEELRNQVKMRTQEIETLEKDLKAQLEEKSIAYNKLEEDFELKLSERVREAVDQHMCNERKPQVTAFGARMEESKIQLKAQYEAREKQLRNELEDLSKKLKQKEDDEINLRGELAILQEKVDAGDGASANNSLSEEDKMRRDFEDQIAKVEDDKRALMKAQETLQNNLRTAEVQLQVSVYKQDFESERNDRQKIHDQYEELKTKIEEARQQHKADKDAMAQLAEEKQNYEEEIQVLTAQVNAYSREVDKQKGLVTQSQEKHKTEVNVLSERLANEIKSKQQLASAHARLRQQFNNVSADKEKAIYSQQKLNNELARMRQQFDDVYADKEELLRAYYEDRARLKDQIEKMKLANKALMDKLKSYRTSTASSQAHISSRRNVPAGNYQMPAHVSSGPGAKGEGDEKEHSYRTYTDLINDQPQFTAEEMAALFKKPAQAAYSEMESGYDEQEAEKEKKRIDRELEELDQLRQQTPFLPQDPSPTLRRLPKAADKNEDKDRPLDPNLICPKCGKQYREGQIQKLRRHMNVRCSDDDSDESDEEIDKDEEEIRRMAEQRRKEMQGPTTAEVLFNDDDDNSLPYDPNLVCPKCGKQYRVGEIQKLRRHMNEFCTGIR